MINNMRVTFRSKEIQDKYDKYQAEGHEGCGICRDDTIKDFAHWKIIPNLFPYDLIATTHHMIVPKRHVDSKELTNIEKEELETLKETYLNDNYEYFFEVSNSGKSIPGHYHIHLIIPKDLK